MSLNALSDADKITKLQKEVAGLTELNSQKDIALDAFSRTVSRQAAEITELRNQVADITRFVQTLTEQCAEKDAAAAASLNRKNAEIAGLREDIADLRNQAGRIENQQGEAALENCGSCCIVVTAVTYVAHSVHVFFYGAS